MSEITVKDILDINIANIIPESFSLTMSSLKELITEFEKKLEYTDCCLYLCKKHVEELLANLTTEHEIMLYLSLMLDKENRSVRLLDRDIYYHKRLDSSIIIPDHRDYLTAIKLADTLSPLYKKDGRRIDLQL